MATDREVHRSCVLLDLPGFVGRRPDSSVHSDGSRDTQQTVNTGRRESPAVYSDGSRDTQQTVNTGRREPPAVHSDGSRDTQQTVNTGRRESPAPTETMSKIRTHKSQSQLPCTPT